MTKFIVKPQKQKKKFFHICSSKYQYGQNIIVLNLLHWKFTVQNSLPKGKIVNIEVKIRSQLFLVYHLVCEILAIAVLSDRNHYVSRVNYGPLNYLFSDWGSDTEKQPWHHYESLLL
jgi:hypothetical protein